eukprot:114747_1
MSAHEAYIHIQKLIVRINALVSTFYTKDVMQKIHENDDEDKIDKIDKKEKDKKVIIDTSSYTVKLNEDDKWFFNPTKGNVVFCSAKHKWGFTIASMAQYYHKTKKMNKKLLISEL